jgi:hypothetical protein
MVGFFGNQGPAVGGTGDVVEAVGPRCQTLPDGAITPLGPLPVGSGTAFGPFDCPAGQVIGVRGRQGAVVDQMQMVCGT